MKYRKVRLEEYVDLLTGHPFKSKEFNEEGKGIKLIRGKNISTGFLKWGGHAKYWDYDYSGLRKYFLEKNDIVIGMDGSKVGKNVNLIKSEDLPLLLVQRVARLRAKKNLTQLYLYYWIDNPNFINYVESIKTGTSIPHISGKQILDYEILLPNLSDQNKIVEILYSIDKKINLNRQIVATLEDLAATLFQHWFVDFEFPDENGNPYKSSGGKMVESELGEIPESCGVTTLEKYVEVKYGKDHKKLADGKYPVYGSGGVMRYVDDYLYDNESVLVPRKGTLNNVMYVHEPFWSVDTMFYTIMKKKNIAKFIYLILDRVDLKSMNVGSAVPSMTTKILNNMKIIQPSENMLTNFEVTVGPMFEKIKQLHTENDTLTELRDTLLPKLLSGEIELPIEEEVRV